MNVPEAQTLKAKVPESQMVKHDAKMHEVKTLGVGAKVPMAERLDSGKEVSEIEMLGTGGGHDAIDCDY